MGSTSKKIKICEIDRISNLPDSLLHKILSLLKFKSAVCTSVLSKRWRPVCMSLTNLDFYDRRYCKNSGIHFSNFVDRFLMHRPNDLKIEKFSLRCGEDYYFNRVSEWIWNVVRRDLKEMNLSFWFGELYVLIPDVFMCTSVEVLRLSGKILVDIPEEDVKLSRLRVLKFDEVTISSYESVGKLLANCPVLEELSFLFCKWLSGDCLSICGSALKKLSLFSDSFFKELEILIDTPALDTLRIGNLASNDILIKENLPFLTTAQIDVEQIIGVVPSSVFGDCVLGLLKKIKNVKFLILGNRTVEALNHAYETEFRTIHDGFPPFHNLTELEINVEEYCGETLLVDFLQNSPNLQSLVFPRGLVNTFSIEIWPFSWGSSQLGVAECLSTHLKTVNIQEFSGTDGELSFVEYLLTYGSALRNVSIDLSNSRGRAEVRQELLNYQRESTTCKLNLFNF